VVAVLLAGLVPDGSAALAQPPPTDPGDEALARSRAQVSARAAEVGRLTGRLADLDARADDLQAALAARREDAEEALETLAAAKAAAAEAKKKADEARVATEAAGTAVDDARARRASPAPTSSCVSRVCKRATARVLPSCSSMSMTTVQRLASFMSFSLGGGDLM